VWYIYHRVAVSKAFPVHNLNASVGCVQESKTKSLVFLFQRVNCRYDPYAAEGESADKADDPGTSERAQGIMAIAKLSSAADGNAEKSADFAKQVDALA